MKQILFVVLVVLGFLGANIISAPSVSAQDAKGLLVTPKRIVFDRSDRILEVLIANRGDSEEKYRISIVNRSMQENGQLSETDTPAENEHFASDVVKYSPRQVSLGPKETQKVRIMSRLKADSPEGEYRSHILIQEVPKAKDAVSANNSSPDGIGVDVRAVFGVSLPVILRKGKLSAETSLSSPEMIKVNEDTFLKVKIGRSGTKSIMGTANIFMGSQKIATLKNVAVYLSTPSRVVHIKIPPEYADKVSGKSLRVTFGAEAENEDAPSAEIKFTP